MQTAAKKRTQWVSLITFLCIITLISAVSLIAANATFTVAEEIYQGVSVADISVGGLAVADAEQKIKNVFMERISKPPLTILYRNDEQDNTWVIEAQDIDFKIDATNLAHQAYAVGRTGNLLNRLQEWYLATNRGHVIPLNVVYSKEKLTDIFNNIAKFINREPVNATIRLKDARVEKNPEIIGRRVDIKKNVDTAANQLITQLSAQMILQVAEITPVVTAKDLADIDSVIAMYTTQFNSGDENRTTNIALAAKGINGVLLKVGEVFSFNDSVGLRLAQYGYKEAPVYLNGNLVPDWGGGVCQVSSTLYNAALLADLRIEERTSHYRPPGYVPLGQDATVADQQLDFCFKNTSAANIYITTVMDSNGRLTVNLLGKRNSSEAEISIIATDKRILEPNTIIRQDPSLDIGREIVEVEGEKGFQVTTQRVKKMDGKEINREFLAADEFPPIDWVIRVGTKAPPKQQKK